MTTSATGAAPPPSLSNETLRERILTGGGGNVRGSLTKVANRYAYFVHTLSVGSNDGENDNRAAAAAAALRTELRLHDLEMRKLILSSKASDGNSARYSSALVRMQTTLEETRRDIESLTATLANERRVKRNREEYDALAKMGNDKHPPIRATRTELERVRAEIRGAREEVREARWELTVRERQMRVFMSSLGDLRATLREEELKNDVRSEGASPSPMTKGKKRKHMGDGGDRSDHSNDDIGAL